MYGVMIQSLRKKHRMSQKELGDKLGIGVSTVSVWESSKRSPSVENLMSIAELFGVSVDYILYGKKDNLDISKDEIALINLYGQLSDNEKSEVKGIIKGLLMASSGNVEK